MLAHFTLATHDVARTARFFDRTFSYRRNPLPANAVGSAVWFDIGGGQEMHILYVAAFEISPYEAEFGRHVALFHPLAGFAALKARLADEGAVLIEPMRSTPFERFFFREPVNGYVFEVIDQARASHFDQ
ncbi:MAG TPA: hypothetical protein VFZ98_01265 [Vicinamibacterales bacterium]